MANSYNVLDKAALKQIRIEPGSKVRLKKHPTDWTNRAELRSTSDDQLKEHAQEYLGQNLRELSKAQDLLSANDTYSLLIILQGMDASGKDGTIKHVTSGINPQGVQVYSFKQPSAEELDHDFLWRYQRALPERGRIGIFNRSHYEELLVVRVHKEWLAKQHLPHQKWDKDFWQKRYADINAFEHHLVRNGTIVLKFFMHMSKEEQKKRFLERLDDPKKHWKFNAGDIVERRYWDEYMNAYEDALTETSTKWAPWYVIPADHKWSARVLVAAVITSAIRSLKLQYPRLTADERKKLEEAKAELLKS